jgi:hypothetical protein
MATGEWGGALDQRVFRVNISFTRADQRCQTGFHLRDLGINTLDPEDVANAVSPWATTQFNKILHVNDRILGVDAENLVTREGFSISYANTPGIQASTPTPGYMSVALAIKGNLRRRYGNGRMLWPVSNINHISGNSLTAPAIGTYDEVVQDLADRFLDTGVASTMKLVHLHPAIAQTPAHPAIPATWYDATSLRLNAALSSLRRRKAGVGS